MCNGHTAPESIIIIIVIHNDTALHSIVVEVSLQLALNKKVLRAFCQSVKNADYIVGSIADLNQSTILIHRAFRPHHLLLD